MINLYYVYLLRYLFEFNLIFFLFSMVFAIIIYYGSKFFNFSGFLKNFSSVYLIRFILIGSLLISFILICFIFWIFIKCYFSLLYFFLYDEFNFNLSDLFFLKLPLTQIWTIKFSIEFFGFIFIILAYIVGLISFLALDTRLYWRNVRFIFICNFLVFVIYMFTIVNDLLLLFLFYETMLIPSYCRWYFFFNFEKF